MVHKVPAHKNLLCNLKKDRKELETDAKSICIDTLPRWENLTDVDIEVAPSETLMISRIRCCVQPLAGYFLDNCVHY